MTIFDLLKNVGIDDLGDVADIASKFLGGKADSKELVNGAKTKEEKTQLLDIIGAMLTKDSKSGNIDFFNLAAEFLNSKDNGVLQMAMNIISMLAKNFPEQATAILPQLLKIASGNKDKEIRKESAGLIATTMKASFSADPKLKTQIVKLAEKETDNDIQKIYNSIIKMFK